MWAEAKKTLSETHSLIDFSNFLVRFIAVTFEKGIAPSRKYEFQLKEI